MVLAVLPLSALVGWQVAEEAAQRRADMESALARAATALAADTDRDLRSSLDALRVLSQSELFQSGRVAALGRLLQGKPRRDWESIFLMDGDGTLLLDTAASHASVEALGELKAIHQRVASSRAPLVSGLVRGAPAGAGVLMALPIQQAGAVRFVLGVRLADSLWQRLVSGADLPDGAKASLFDAQRHLVSYSTGPAVPAGTLLPNDAAEGMDGLAAGVQRTSDVDGEMVYFAWEPVASSGWTAAVSRPAAPFDRSRLAFVASAIGVVAAAIAIGVGLALAFSRKWLAPAAGATLSRHELRNHVHALGTAADVLAAVPPESADAAEARSIIARRSRELSALLGTDEAPAAEE